MNINNLNKAIDLKKELNEILNFKSWIKGREYLKLGVICNSTILDGSSYDISKSSHYFPILLIKELVSKEEKRILWEIKNLK